MNHEEIMEFILIITMRVQIERGYALLERLDELYERDVISLDDYLEYKREIREALDDHTQNNPFNELKEELNLITL